MGVLNSLYNKLNNEYKEYSIVDLKILDDKFGFVILSDKSGCTMTLEWTESLKRWC